MFQPKQVALSSILKIIRKYGIAGFLVVTVTAVLLLFTLADSNIFNTKYAFAYGYGYGTPGGTTTPPATETPGEVDISDMISSGGEFTQNVIITSVDNNVEINIGEGTVGLDADGAPLAAITLNEMTSPPDPPAQSNIIGLTYDFGPVGATFNPPITLTFTYDPDNIPAGVDPADLKIAFYDSATGTWTVLDNIVVDPVTHTISGTTSHFTAFSIIAHTAPASFAVSNLVLSPTEVAVGETSTITVTVTNSGDLTSTYDVVLKIANRVVETKSVTVKGHTTTEVAFSVIPTYAQDNIIDVNGLTGRFVVAPAPTTPATTTPAPTTPAPTTPAPTTPAPTTPAPTTPAPTTPAPTTPVSEISIDWALIGGLLAAVVVVFGFLWLYLARRRD